jgi:hypothetical protein
MLSVLFSFDIPESKISDRNPKEERFFSLMVSEVQSMVVWFSPCLYRTSWWQEHVAEEVLYFIVRQKGEREREREQGQESSNDLPCDLLSPARLHLLGFSELPKQVPLGRYKAFTT